MTQLPELIARIEGYLPQLDAECGSESTKPNPPASAADIDAVEKTLGRALPSSYRSFLQLHNGWKQFFDFELFEARSIIDPEIQELMAGQSNHDEQAGAVGGMWIGRRLEEDEGYYLKPGSAGDDWVFMRVTLGTSVRTMSSFTDLLEWMAQHMQEMLADLAEDA